MAIDPLKIYLIFFTSMCLKEQAGIIRHFDRIWLVIFLFITKAVILFAIKNKYCIGFNCDYRVHGNNITQFLTIAMVAGELVWSARILPSLSLVTAVDPGFAR